MALIDNVRVMGSGLNRDIRNALVEASISGDLKQVTQLELKLIDNGWNILASGLLVLGMTVQIDDLKLEISNISTDEVQGTEGVTVKCRPIVVRKLRDRRGPKVMRNASPSDFVIAECKAVGAKYVVQSSGKRNQVSRDVPKKGEHEVEQPPSSWTTFQRLAREIGYIVFEAAGTIYFGKPSWLLSAGQLPTYTAQYKTGPEEKRTLTTPRCERSKDNPVANVSFTTLVSSVSEVRPGKKLILKGVPTFDGDYLVASFDVDLLENVHEASVTATTPINPQPQPQNPSKNKPRIGTRAIADFMYWVLKQIGDSYVTGTEVNLGSNDPNRWDGSELVEWGAFQVGAFMPNHPNDQIEYCRRNGTEISVAAGIKTRGAILWRNNYVGISLGNGQVIEEVKGRVGIVKGGAERRYTRAGKIPGVLY